MTSPGGGRDADVLEAAYAPRVEEARLAPVDAAERRRMLAAMRTTYAGAMLNGPFAVIAGHDGGMVGLSDRLKLRPLAAATKGDRAYIASEEAAIWAADGKPDTAWAIDAGTPVRFDLN